MDKFDEAYLAVAKQMAQLSKDRSTKVGAVIVDRDRIPRSMGYNGFPRGIDDTIEERHDRPAKYLWTEHAERNAIYNFARPYFKGTVLYSTHPPCADCARAIVQVGISEVRVVGTLDNRWNESTQVAALMFEEAGIIYREL